MSATPTSTESRDARPTPTERYRADLERDDFQYDPAQEQAVAHLQRLFDELMAAPRRRPRALPPQGRLATRMAGLFGKRRRDEPDAEPVLPADRKSVGEGEGGEPRREPLTKQR